MTILDQTRATQAHPRRELTPVAVAFADYDRTRPLIDGRVKADGLALKIDTRWIGDFCRRPVYEEYDAAEMSFSWYVGARGRGEPVIAIPIFLLRMPVLGYVFVRKDSPIAKPSDLIGKRIGSRGYRQTVNLWLRGLFNEHYGLSPEQATWVLAEDVEGAGYTIPKHIPVDIRKGSSAIDNLKDGVVDAMFCTSVPEAFRKGEGWLRRLFPDAQAETEALVRRTGVMPVTHVLAMNERLAQRQPWIAESLYRAFVNAQSAADATYRDPKAASLFGAEFLLERHLAAYGANPYVQGLEPNRKVIETFVRYAHEQGYITHPIPADELFVPATRAL